MAHSTGISPSIFADLSVCLDTVPLPATYDAAGFNALFSTEVANGVAIASGAPTGEFRRITNVREFPSLGTPANIVNVPTYGQSISSQVGGQADAPTIEITLNYVATDWQYTANYLGFLVGKDTQYAFRFTLLNEIPTATGSAAYASTAAGLGTVKNSIWYWVGRVEALIVNPQLTDAVTATLTLSTQTDFYGAYTV